MKTQQEIEQMIEDLDSKRLESIAQRDNATNDTDYSVAHNLVLIYAMQHSILLEILK